MARKQLATSNHLWLGLEKHTACFILNIYYPIDLTKHIAGVDLQDQPAVFLVRIRPEDGEDGALLTRLRQQLVHVHLLFGKLKLFPGFPLVGTEPEPANSRQRSVTP